MAFQTARGWRALVITGQSGTGKSELALVLMAMGARLVADDQTELLRQDAHVLARAPGTIQGLIEMRHLGILRVDPIPEAIVEAIIDMDTRELDRMPPIRRREVCGCALRLFHRIDTPAFASALRHYILQPDPAC
ncbi:MAG: HPr kinase/phosphorylase [Roseinatronobacter sp.]